MLESFELLLTVPQTRVLCGEGMPVELSVHNRGATTIALSLGLARPLVFALRPLVETASYCERSSGTALLEALGDRSKPLPPDLVLSVAPGETLELEDDPGAASAIPIAPGRYAMSARLVVDGIARSSNEIDIEVEAPVVAALTALYCRQSGSQVQAFVTRSASPGVYLRDTLSVRADASVFWRLADAPGACGIAASVQVDPGLAGRWCAWLSEGGLLSAVAALSDGPVTDRVDLPTQLDDPLLAEPALQRGATTPTHEIFDWGEAVFLVAGGHQGQTVLRSFVASGTGIVAGAAIPLGERRPAQLLVRWSMATRTTRLVWPEHHEGTLRLMMLQLSPTFEPLTRAEVLYQVRGRVLALAMSPLDDGRSSGCVHALVDPRAAEGDVDSLCYVCIPLPESASDGPVVITHRLPRPKEPIGAFAVASDMAGNGLVLATIGDEVWRCAAAAPDPQWHRHLGDVPGLGELRLATTPEGYWASIGVDPRRGVICAQDPQFSNEH